MNKDINELNKDINIVGLHWIKRWRVNNGKHQSYVIPFATTYPINIVYHGKNEFKYGQYGIHLGQQDTLTFLGDKKQKILAKFIDCRKNSPTFKSELSLEITPSSARTLIIPPGVAHTFSHLENVFTLNSYSLFLPTIEQLASETLNWSPNNDVINLPEDIDINEIEGYEPMTEEASALVYYRVAEIQQQWLSQHRFLHSETRKIRLDNGDEINVRLREKIADVQKQSLPTSTILGVEFREMATLHTGKESGIVPLTRQSPMYLVEHGQEAYDFDSYGLHLGQEDHLTFLGDTSGKITIKLVDMREDSPTLFYEDEMVFDPAPNIELVIPCGVAHALFNMANIITVNRPVIYLDEEKEYIPGHDVIDWKIANKNYQAYRVNKIAADLTYYQFLVSKQQALMKHKPTHHTPKSIIVYDENNQPIKVLIKEKV
ncbi:dTDP-4-dehydrorhamnose 3,5-epimerase family protein [Proteus mirabilis]|nr:dTDP-4-dehydrorhamnose 3,5-epimerase family protein [Proteus mirabilis]MBG2824475.1 dTDP-4-dehydrorhamnose 3,5-epimerase family protein [Proteus mirabilis]MBG2855064.1 dTDP-4-dehydrorhamnose 3,5-epimerase family protein [Proteus mirabilis]MCL8574797.1 dTDP-4-dehydrorhamnose 3,5-epimerase family protein [Proteus mirabilis]HCZ9067210.1 dTDP-4-dehydrorhamnose 3,5-epimerase family protein [Proteus mirabilis]